MDQNTTHVAEAVELKPAAASHRQVAQLPAGGAVKAPTAPQNTARQLSVVEYAVQNGAPVSEVRALVELQIQMDNHKLAMRRQDDEREKELRAEAARNAYAQAMADFKAKTIRVVRTRLITDGPLKGKKHADLFSVVDAATVAMSECGLSASWETLEDAKDWIRIACRIKHVAGHSESVSFSGPVDTGPGRNAIQARKSTVSYLERITMLLALGLAEQDEDDDGAGSGPVDTGRRGARDDGDSRPVPFSTLLADLRKTTTDKAALDFWLQHRASTGGPSTNNYIEFKNAAAQHRADLAARAEA